MTGPHDAPNEYAVGHPETEAADVPVQPDTAPTHERGLVEFRQVLRHRLRTMTADDRLALDESNRLLNALEEPPLRRQWTVDVTMTFRCDATAGYAHDAVEAAETMVANAIDDAGPLPLALLWECRSSSDPIPGDLDRTNP